MFGRVDILNLFLIKKRSKFSHLLRIEAVFDRKILQCLTFFDQTEDILKNYNIMYKCIINI